MVGILKKGKVVIDIDDYDNHTNGVEFSASRTLKIKEKLIFQS